MVNFSDDAVHVVAAEREGVLECKMQTNVDEANKVQNARGIVATAEKGHMLAAVKQKVVLRRRVHLAPLKCGVLFQ